jgi:hypothetical protein
MGLARTAPPSLAATSRSSASSRGALLTSDAAGGASEEEGEEVAACAPTTGGFAGSATSFLPSIEASAEAAQTLGVSGEVGTAATTVAESSAGPLTASSLDSGGASHENRSESVVFDQAFTSTSHTLKA